ncbi:MAG: patatin-like phospholipase family protein [Deltaproteobacteria bacterium]|nr:patatin-like phospholipase family protein [Deltaproteobacteria bacterium]MBW1924956.1 patatin-like phospholipase family protein [Deltaproteobacteria bacterium]MBW1948855.1 patatin-like phospholipase family protein [Deltaproteobacteria bacterium]MBW2006702.1 patatin-like phospholipase family protein [Deltaproteobacteria bacterium]MBW2102063.1 patatin-like phospholipase family protein [Deltaproteobacteria bacterium]
MLNGTVSMPLLFKPVEINGGLYVDGGVVNKAPVQALADLLPLDRILVHLIPSRNLEQEKDAFLRKSMPPLHIHTLAMNIARRVSYERQVEAVRMRGVEEVEIVTRTPSLGPHRLDRGPAAYAAGREQTLSALVSQNS